MVLHFEQCRNCRLAAACKHIGPTEFMALHFGGTTPPPTLHWKAP